MRSITCIRFLQISYRSLCSLLANLDENSTTLPSHLNFPGTFECKFNKQVNENSPKFLPLGCTCLGANWCIVLVKMDCTKDHSTWEKKMTLCASVIFLFPSCALLLFSQSFLFETLPLSDIALSSWVHFCNTFEPCYVKVASRTRTSLLNGTLVIKWTLKWITILFISVNYLFTLPAASLSWGGYTW